MVSSDGRWSNQRLGSDHLKSRRKTLDEDRFQPLTFWKSLGAAYVEQWNSCGWNDDAVLPQLVHRNRCRYLTIRIWRIASWPIVIPNDKLLCWPIATYICNIDQLQFHEFNQMQIRPHKPKGWCVTTCRYCVRVWYFSGGSSLDNSSSCTLPSLPTHNGSLMELLTRAGALVLQSFAYNFLVLCQPSDDFAREWLKY